MLQECQGEVPDSLFVTVTGYKECLCILGGDLRVQVNPLWLQRFAVRTEFRKVQEQQDEINAQSWYLKRNQGS